MNEWIRNSPHSSLCDSMRSHINTSSSYSVKSNNELFELYYNSENGYGHCGSRHTVHDSEKIWRTEVVGYKQEDQFNISIRQYCESKNLLLDRPKFKKPYIFNLISQKLGKSHDGDLIVQNKPLTLKPSDVALAASIINGTYNFNLPCVYISLDNHGNYSINPEALAKELYGMAHVVVEPSRYFSFDLQYQTHGRNAYNGAVGIYFPKSKDRLTIILQKLHKDSRSTERYISQKIRDALVLQLIP